MRFSRVVINLTKTGSCEEVKLSPIGLKLVLCQNNDLTKT